MASLKPTAIPAWADRNAIAASVEMNHCVRRVLAPLALIAASCATWAAVWFVVYLPTFGL